MKKPKPVYVQLVSEPKPSDRVEHAQAIRTFAPKAILKVKAVEHDRDGDVYYFTSATAPWSASLFHEYRAPK